MKALAFVLLLASLRCTAQLQTDDRFLHATYSGLITGTVAGYAHFRGMKKHHAIMLGIGASLAIGSVKEFAVDQAPSLRDFKSNTLGISVVAVAFALPIERPFRRIIPERKYRKRK